METPSYLEDDVEKARAGDGIPPPSDCIRDCDQELAEPSPAVPCCDGEEGCGVSH